MKKTRKINAPKNLRTVAYVPVEALNHATIEKDLRARVNTVVERAEADNRARDDFHTQNHLYKGDNLQIMRSMPAGVVDLVYLDPPFNTGLDWFMKDASGTSVKTFTDKWEWNDEREEEYQELLARRNAPLSVGLDGTDYDNRESVARAMESFRHFLGECPMLAYLTFMAIRLVECRRVMK